MLRNRDTCRLEASPLVAIMQAGYRHDFAMVETYQRSVDHHFHRHHDRLGQVLPREPRLFPQIGCSCARQHRLNANALVGQLVLQGMTERDDKSFGRAVNAVQILGRDALDRRDIDDRAPTSRHEAGDYRRWKR